MSIAALAPARLKFEPDGIDFPYYADNPQPVSGAGRLLVLTWAYVWTKTSGVAPGRTSSTIGRFLDRQSFSHRLLLRPETAFL